MTNLWTPDNTWRIRGSGRQWFDRILRETFGAESQNIIEPPPSGQQPPLLLHSSLQPVYIVNGAEFQSNPTQLEANVQAEISAGRGTMENNPLYVEEVKPISVGAQLPWVGANPTIIRYGGPKLGAPPQVPGEVTATLTFANLTGPAGGGNWEPIGLLRSVSALATGVSTSNLAVSLVYLSIAEAGGTSFYNIAWTRPTSEPQANNSDEAYSLVSPPGYPVTVYDANSNFIDEVVVSVDITAPASPVGISINLVCELQVWPDGSADYPFGTGQLLVDYQVPT